MSLAWDERAWRALADELERWGGEGRRATVWWRDDDAGPPDPALERLLTLAARLELPLGLAVVPAWLTEAGGALIDAAPASVLVLQHGFAHANHERTILPGERKIRPAECGGARPLDVVLDELALGRARLGALLGARTLSVLVPPWNRIAPAVLEALPASGYGAVSTFGPRVPRHGAPPLRLNTHVDPIAWREGKGFVGAAESLDRLREHLVARREGRADSTEATGILTHHRDLSPPLWDFVAEALGRLHAHPHVEFPALRTLFDSARESPTGP